MFANGYVGTSEDALKLRKLGKQREQQRKKFEELQEKKKREAAGLRQFGASKSEQLEAAFKSETVGLVTRQEFLEKRATIQDRLAEDELRERIEAEAAAQAEKERKRKEKEKKKAKSKLSFAGDVSAWGCSSLGGQRRAAQATSWCIGNLVVRVSEQGKSAFLVLRPGAHCAAARYAATFMHVIHRQQLACSGTPLANSSTAS